MLTNGAFRFGNFLLDVSAIFMFVLWFWLLITVIGDLFRRQRHFVRIPTMSPADSEMMSPGDTR